MGIGDGGSNWCIKLLGAQLVGRGSQSLALACLAGRSACRRRGMLYQHTGWARRGRRSVSWRFGGDGSGNTILSLGVFFALTDLRVHRGRGCRWPGRGTVCPGLLADARGGE